MLASTFWSNGIMEHWNTVKQCGKAAYSHSQPKAGSEKMLLTLGNLAHFSSF